ncbi:hypothetical protein VTH8203_02756 [Vibrio thalassae]|uniref:Uncharacterized protein n=1 Tax=Vibrio thalassae TaxID=1243014 RepID=A0A240ELT4_9VIBR|nr:hypothetical protein [Vibrio thalassae]SNX49119.1 hypothetical protein VTH8203_02756 [Vibrio thalassae]
MILIIFIGVAMSYWQVDLLFEFMRTFSVCEPYLSYNNEWSDGFYQCHGLDVDFVKHARRNLKDLFFFLFILPYGRFAALTFIKTGI